MNDRESRDAIIELTDEVESWQQKLLDERKAHDATLADLRSELAATREARDEWERRAYEVLGERAISDFWEAETARYRGVKQPGDVRGAVCIEDMATWHARRTTR